MYISFWILFLGLLFRLFFLFFMDFSTELNSVLGMEVYPLGEPRQTLELGFFRSF